MAERVLVTGAAGFVASHVVRRLVRDGADVVALVRPRSDVRRIADVVDDVELLRVELGGDRPMRAGRLDRVLHLAAAGVVGRVPDAKVVQANVLGTLQALELARAGGAAAFLYCGSCFEYGPGELHREDGPLRPVSAYGASKAAGWTLAEAYGREHGLHVTGVRPFTVYGPGEAPSRLVPSVCLGAARREPVALSGGLQTRDFVYVDDAVEAILRAARTVAGGIFNICTGSAVAVHDVAVEIASLAGGDVELRFGALPERPAELATLSGDPTAARKTLGWLATTSLRDGLRATLDWFADQEGADALSGSRR